ncbi:MAG: hypothetical protein IJY42_02755, partial [Clostridia bacterium]|nr:hypothetical protein [Clostridia bacterium]
MKKFLCLLFCLCLLVSTLAACAGTGDTPEETTTPVNEDEVTTTTTPPPSGDNGTTTTESGNDTTTLYQGVATMYPKHTAYDFGDSFGNPLGYNFFARTGRVHYIDGEANSTSDITIAAYKRNQVLESMYNINIKVTLAGGSSNAAEESNFRTRLGVASGEYDIAVPDVWWALELGGYFTNLMTIPEINIDDEYWVDGWNDNLIINNRMYSIAGDATLELYENLEVIYFNKAIAATNNLDMYKLVEEDKWTLDYMIELGESVFEPTLTNTDPSDDVYCVQYNVHSMRQSLFNAGITMLQTNRYNAIITPICNTERNIAICDKITEMIWSTS